jgi:hypothetical protein
VNLPYGFPDRLLVAINIVLILAPQRFPISRPSVSGDIQRPNRKPAGALFSWRVVALRLMRIWYLAAFLWRSVALLFVLVVLDLTAGRKLCQFNYNNEQTCPANVSASAFAIVSASATAPLFVASATNKPDTPRGGCRDPRIATSLRFRQLLGRTRARQVSDIR